MADYWFRIAVTAGVVAVLSAALVPAARRIAFHFSVIDHPKPGKFHHRVTPYLGGLAIVPVAALASQFLPHWKAEVVVIAFAALMVAAVGLVDDVRTLSPAPRLAVEAVAASAVFFVGARVDVFGGPADYVLTVGWLVVLTNSFNLLDNMDGCAGLIAVVMATGMAVAAGMQGQVLVGGMAALVAGACLGFLPANWHPASIFMGDTGSLFLGFILATLSLKLRFPVSHAESISALLLIAGPVLFDTTLVVLSRLRAGRPIYIGGTDHTSHRLMRLGLPVPAVAGLLGGAVAVCTALGVAVGHNALPATAVLAVMLAVGVVALILLLRLPLPDNAGREEAAVPTVATA
ncbi:MAG: glycosyltransferase family 4 protein [Acidimicrobiia bacterium]